jgi:XTP/dITP diphosphohydrolase
LFDRGFVIRHRTARALVLGTGNRKKAVELADLLRPLELDVRTRADYPQAIEVEEGDDSFAANARRKATEQARHLHCWVLGEDSGLMVDALGGAPGVLSARYAGPHATDRDNNRKLLKALGATPLDCRAARYVCHMTVADSTGAVRAESTGSCRGRIALAPVGTAGFGYDPLFEIVEYHRTFGQLGGPVKQLLSHRSRAARQLLPQIAALIRAGHW